MIQFLNPAISVSSTTNGDDYVEYDTEGESDFEENLKRQMNMSFQ